MAELFRMILPLPEMEADPASLPEGLVKELVDRGIADFEYSQASGAVVLETKLVEMAGSWVLIVLGVAERTVAR